MFFEGNTTILDRCLKKFVLFCDSLFLVFHFSKIMYIVLHVKYGNEIYVINGQQQSIEVDKITRIND